MTIDRKIKKEGNALINTTLIASYQLLTISIWLETTLLFKGLAQRMRNKSDTYQLYASTLFSHAKHHIGLVELSPIDTQKKIFKSPSEAFKHALEVQRKVTKAIHRLYAIALKEKDYKTQKLLSKLASQQTKEEKATSDLLDKLKIANGNIDTLLHIDYVQEKGR